ncbi:MAG: hypothetical protein MUF15_09450 [Acidobacteria bacterium]|nr:hypothetical protein [Acidobacteriota bacterium]
MEYLLEERIGDPVLFTGRKEELEYFLKWITGIKKKQSQSTALLARRKMGKTAILERLFNITFSNNNGIIPFYYEIKETKMWIVDFCKDFFLTFIYQYIAFKTRKPEYLKPENTSDFDKVIEIVRKEGLDYLVGILEGAAHAVAHEEVDILWNIAREAPQTIAFRQKEFIIQMIDEFQFLNAMIYRDKETRDLANTLAGGYLSTAESKIAPLLVSGSWVGWLMNELMVMLPSRFRYYYLDNMPQDEAIEMIYNYSQHFEVPITEETAYLMAQMAEGSPFYISSIIRSSIRSKNLTTVKGLTDALEYETLDNRGVIKLTWMEYIAGAFPQINDRDAKNVVLHLCKNRDRELTREEIRRDLKLEMTDSELEKKLKALVKSDIIAQGQTDFDYRGVSDNIFDKVFRGVYEKEIRQFDIKTIREEYGQQFEKLKAQYHCLLGKYNNHKGLFAEYVIINRLRSHGREDNDLLKSMIRYLPGDFNFCEYVRVWHYDYSPDCGKRFNIDIYAQALSPGNYSLIGEVKNRDLKKFTKEEAIEFERKYCEVKAAEHLDKALGFIFSRTGFTQEAEEYCREKGFACTDDERWLTG